MLTYRMSCATQRCTARIESSSVLAPFTACVMAESTDGEATYRSRAFPAYHLPIAAHVIGEEIMMDMYTPFESDSNASDLTLLMSVVAHVYVWRPFADFSVRAKLRLSSRMRGVNPAGTSTM